LGEKSCANSNSAIHSKGRGIIDEERKGKASRDDERQTERLPNPRWISGRDLIKEISPHPPPIWPEKKSIGEKKNLATGNQKILKGVGMNGYHKGITKTFA